MLGGRVAFELEISDDYLINAHQALMDIIFKKNKLVFSDTLSVCDCNNIVSVVCVILKVVPHQTFFKCTIFMLDIVYFQ